MIHDPDDYIEQKAPLPESCPALIRTNHNQRITIPSLQEISDEFTLEVKDYLMIKNGGFISVYQKNLDKKNVGSNPVKFRLSVNEHQLEASWLLIGDFLTNNVFSYFKINDSKYRKRVINSFFDMDQDEYEEYERNIRFMLGSQFTFYLPASFPDERISSVIDCLFNIQKILLANNISPGIQSESDLSISKFISGRVHFFNGKYIPYRKYNKELIDRLNKENKFLNHIKSEFLKISRGEKMIGYSSFCMFGAYQSTIVELRKHSKYTKKQDEATLNCIQN